MYGSNIAHIAKTKGMDVPGLQREIYASAKEDVKSQLVLNAVAEREGMVLEDADRQEFAESNGQTVEEAVGNYGQNVFDEIALNYKVMKFLGSVAVNAAAPASGEATPSDAKTGAAEGAAKETEAAETAAAKTAEAETTKAKTAEAETTAAQ